MSGLRRPLLVAAAVAGLIGLGALVFAMTRSDDDGSEAGRDLGEQPEVTRPGGRGLVVDTFAADDSDRLGSTETGHRWFEVSGSWSVDDSEATAAPDGDTGAAVAVVDPRQVDGTYTVTMSRVVPGAGVVFRYAGPRNFWYLSAAPQAATWRVVRVVEGEPIEVDTLGVAPIGDGTTIAVESEGATLAFTVDGQRRKAITDEALVGHSRVGLFASGTGTDQPRWSTVAFSAAESAGETLGGPIPGVDTTLPAFPITPGP